MPRRTYGEESRNAEERRINDGKLLETFISQLEDEEEADKASSVLESAESVEATATYRLDHPYEGENFWRYSLLYNETVSAQVDLEIVADDVRMDYSGRVYGNAYDVFELPDAGGEHEPVEADADMASGTASVETD